MPPPTPRRRAWLLLLVLAAVATLGACSSGSSEPDRSPEDVLAAAKQTLDETPGVQIVLATEQLPEGVTGVLSATGVGVHPPAFRGDLKVVASGITADVAVVAVGGEVYAKLPFTTEFAPVNPRDYGAPDPADLMRPEGGLSSLLTATQEAERGQQARDGELLLTEYTGTLPGGAVASIIPGASAQDTYDVRYRITDDDELRETVITGPFYSGSEDVSYRITFDQYGIEPEVTAP